MKNNISITYYLNKGTIEESFVKDLLYIIPYSQFIKKYHKNSHASIGLAYPDKEEYILIDWYQCIYCNRECIISYKKHSLKNIMASRFYTVQLITFSKKTKINEIINEIFPYYCGGYDGIRKAKDKVKKFIEETIKEYEK